MDSIVLSLRECTKGWRVFQGELPLFWFAEYEEAVATARMVAEVHVDLRAVAASIELHRLGESAVHITTLAPVAQGSA